MSASVNLLISEMTVPESGQELTLSTRLRRIILFSRCDTLPCILRVCLA
jgi:hypothetical protein